jgi:hypothetical protein
MRYTRYLHTRNIVAHKLMKIQLEQGEGLNKQKTYYSCLWQIIIFPHSIHTVLTRSKLWDKEQFQLTGLKIQPGFNDKSQ